MFFSIFEMKFEVDARLSFGSNDSAQTRHFKHPQKLSSTKSSTKLHQLAQGTEPKKISFFSAKHRLPGEAKGSPFQFFSAL